MKLFTKYSLLITLFIFSALSFTIFVKGKSPKIDLNQEYIEQLLSSSSQINIEKHLEVFENIFNSLPNEVTIYPSENYYYFEFVSNGINFQGNIGLFHDELLKGQVNFGYYVKSGHVFSDMDDIYKYYSLGKKDGLTVKRIDAYTNSIEYKGKEIIFNSFKFDLSKNKNLKTREHEVLIAPTFDESGTPFYLIYNKEVNYFYWILNEHTGIKENLNKYSEDLYYSKRTDFLFYNDKKYDRKVLVGVNYYNIRKNNWYDGPFDQMPDNIIDDGKASVLPYLKLAFPSEASNFDKYGNFLDDESSRIALSSYQTYINISDIENKIKYLKLENIPDFDVFYNLVWQ
ncbi:hypothetical protein [Tenacibaculum sp. 1_MG-2023]|uniref:hypothetical protein n=1 Tax=Tenacibaculum sp. 1_MG-2023 TaxID=3062653 RepID=UPI0026E2FEA7|nr:hypothetical protein [Tenacibaculum sp. 1_MG-2023]